MSYHDLKLGDLMLPESIKSDIERSQLQNAVNFAAAIPGLLEWLLDPDNRTAKNRPEYKRNIERLLNHVAYVNKYMVPVAAINYVEFGPHTTPSAE